MVTTQKIETNYQEIPLEETVQGFVPQTNTPATPVATSNIVPTGGGSVLAGGAFQSPNYSVGVAGWKIDSNGDVEFGSGKFRGSITGATGTFTGTITATTGTIGGWSINATSITAIGGSVSSTSSGPNSPSTMADDATVGTVAWTSPDFAKVEDGDTTGMVLSAGETSHYLKATNFGFAIPTGATIDGILVEIKEQGANSKILENAIKIVKSDGSIGTTNKSTGATLPASLTYVSYGASDNLWGETWTAEDINDADFGVVFSGTRTGTGIDLIAVDHVRITVYYTTATVAGAVGMSSASTVADDVRFWAGGTTPTTAPFRVTESGAVTGSSITITGGAISGTPISSIPNSTATDISLLEKTHNLVFSVTDADTIAWTAGTIVLSNGRTFTIDAGNTGNMTALTYIYLDTAVSSTVLQTTTTYSTAMGANKTLLGTAQNNTVTASFIPYGAGQPLIDGANIGALSIVAGNIAAGTITATQMTVATLSAITADMGSITAGSITVAAGGNTVAITPGETNAIIAGPTGTPTFILTTAGALTATSATIGGYLTGASFAGDGSDGAATFENQGTAPTGTTKTDNTDGATIYRLDRDVFYTSMTVNSTVTVNTNSYRIFNSGTLTDNGTISNKGNDGTAGGTGGNGGGGTGGTAGTAGTTGTVIASGSLPGGNASGAPGAGGAGANVGPSNTDGTVGANGTAGTGAAKSIGVVGVAGSNGGAGGIIVTGAAGGSGAAAGSLSGTVFNVPRNATSAYYLLDVQPSVATLTDSSGSGGGGGGGGGTAGASGGAGGGGGGGGGAGSCGGMIVIFSKAMAGSGVITVAGGAGGVGGNGGNSQATPNAGGGGGGSGGSGGSGGAILLVYGTTSGTWTTSVAGGAAGAGGNGGTGNGTGQAGSNGTIGNAGTTGKVYTITLS